jgi:hypothetical protein
MRLLFITITFVREDAFTTTVDSQVTDSTQIWVGLNEQGLERALIVISNE